MVASTPEDLTDLGEKLRRSKKKPDQRLATLVRPLTDLLLSVRKTVFLNHRANTSKCPFLKQGTAPVTCICPSKVIAALSRCSVHIFNLKMAKSVKLLWLAADIGGNGAGAAGEERGRPEKAAGGCENTISTEQHSA